MYVSLAKVFIEIYFIYANVGYTIKPTYYQTF